MTYSDNLQEILERIAKGTYTEADLTTLSKEIVFRGDSNVMQLGNYNVNISQGRDIQIGDRIYQGPSAEAIKTIFLQVLDEYNGNQNAVAAEKPTSYIRETVYSTLFPVEEMPRYIYGAPCKYNDSQVEEARQEIGYPHVNDENIYPFLLRDGMLFCFQNLKNPTGYFSKIVTPQETERCELSNWCDNPDRNKWLVTLLNYSLNKLTGRKRLRLDKIHRRYYFPILEAGSSREIEYRPLNQSTATRQVVWQPITKKTKKPKPFWYHLAVALQFHQVSKKQWCLSIRPELRLTKDGFTSIESDKIGSRVTHAKSRKFNYDLLGDVNFWRDYLGNEKHGKRRIILPFNKKQRIIISTNMLQSQIEWPGIPEEHAMPFKNVEYPEDLFSWAELSRLKEQDSEEFDDWEDLDNDDIAQEFEDEE